jgi:hypothetical protein
MKRNDPMQLGAIKKTNGSRNTMGLIFTGIYIARRWLFFKGCI